MVDGGVAGALVAALLAVVGLDTLLTIVAPAPENTTGTETVIKTPPGRVKRLRLAVTPVFTSIDPRSGRPLQWDDVGTLLKELGPGYKDYETIQVQDLADIDKLRQYDIVFFSCGAGQFDPRLANTLQAYVSQGGILYASDWRYPVVAQAFPELRAPELESSGFDTAVNAEVVDAGLRDMLGQDHIKLTFELDAWMTAAFKGDRVKVLLRGTFRSHKFGNETRTAPLLVKFSFGKGTVIFTSYHHGKTHDEQEKKLLKYLIFSVATAKVEQELEETQVKNQFSPAKSNLFSASVDNPKATYSYDNVKAGTLRFDLGFEDRGAELKLAAKSPSGKVYEKQGTKSFFIEVPNAEQGSWTYTITALQVPYENFAFLVNVSHGKK
jgi:hypothetical protein